MPIQYEVRGILSSVILLHIRYKLISYALLTLVQANKYPDEEGLVSQRSALGQVFVQFRVHHGLLAVQVLVQHQREDREHGVDGGVPDHEEPLRKVNSSVVLYTVTMIIRYYFAHLRFLIKSWYD